MLLNCLEVSAKLLLLNFVKGLVGEALASGFKEILLASSLLSRLPEKKGGFFANLCLSAS